MDIEGVEIYYPRQILDYRGKVMNMMTRESDYFHGFGGVYFVSVHPGMVKAWHEHTKTELNYVCVYGKVLVVIIDLRENSPTKDNTMEVYLSPEDYKLLKIPPGVLNGMKGLGQTDSIVCNCTTLPHEDAEMVRYPLDVVEYDWWKRGS